MISEGQRRLGPAQSIRFATDGSWWPVKQPGMAFAQRVECGSPEGPLRGGGSCREPTGHCAAVFVTPHTQRRLGPAHSIRLAVGRAP